MNICRGVTLYMVCLALFGSNNRLIVPRYSLFWMNLTTLICVNVVLHTGKAVKSEIIIALFVSDALLHFVLLQ